MSFARPIVRVANVQSGRPCFENSRFPVRSLAPYIIHGHSDDFILEQFPTLTADDVETARMIYDGIDNIIAEHLADDVVARTIESAQETEA